jgi:hypothetical protein
MNPVRLFCCVYFVLAAIGFSFRAPCAASSEKAQNNSTDERLLQWNRETLVTDYQRHGSRNPKWDNSAILALETFAKIRGGAKPPEKYIPAVADATKAAVTNGCDDPMIKYLYARFVLPNEKHTSEDHAKMYASVVEELEKGKRSPIRKFYASLRASEGFNMQTASTVAAVHHWRDEAKRYLVEVANDKETPGKEVAEAWALLLDTVGTKAREYDDVYLSVEPIVLKNWPSESDLYLQKGRFYADYAWKARGSGYADSVSSQGWKLFEQRLDVADAALTKAWSLNPHDERIARAMLTVELGQGKGRPRMEQWFQRAMALNTNNYDACWAKLYYLEPKWYGSRDQMLEFAAECLNSDKWGGHVPLIVVDVHEKIAKTLGADAQEDYWKRPEVWTDLHQAFEKFFRLNPDATGWHHNYALYAYRAQQWDELNKQIGLLGPINYNYFGGREKFDEIVRQAKEHAAKTHPP